MRAREIELGRGNQATKDSRHDAESIIEDRPRLTLRHLNKLRKIRELRKLELAKKAADVKNMYGEEPDCTEENTPPMIPRETN